MRTVYDFVSVAAFGILVSYFIFLTDRSQRVLLHFLVPAVTFAIANQIGNAALKADNIVLHAAAIVLIFVGIVYAAIVVRY